MLFNLPTDLLTHPGFWAVAKWFIIAFFVFSFFNFLYLYIIKKANEKANRIAQEADLKEHNILLTRINKLEKLIRIQKEIPIPIRKRKMVPLKRR